MTRTYLPGILAMAAIVVASNILVQFLFGQWLTWGAFTYPVAFLVTDLTNRRFGPSAARVIVAFGFVLAVAFSIWLATPRIAIASGSAFIVAQLLDVSVFERLRRSAWWKAPLVSSLIGSVIDTVLFFGVAFSAGFAFLDTGFGLEDGSLGFPVPFLGVGGEVPLWVSLGAGDFCVKILVALVLLAPYRVLRGLIADRSAVTA